MMVALFDVDLENAQASKRVVRMKICRGEQQSQICYWIQIVEEAVLFNRKNKCRSGIGLKAIAEVVATDIVNSARFVVRARAS